MTHIRKIPALLLLLAALAQPAHAAGCYADYKAKQDNPLQLHYGVIELPDPIDWLPTEWTKDLPIPR